MVEVMCSNFEICKCYKKSQYLSITYLLENTVDKYAEHTKIPCFANEAFRLTMFNYIEDITVKA